MDWQQSFKKCALRARKSKGFLPLILLSAVLFDIYVVTSTVSPTLPSQKNPIVFYSNQKNTNLKQLYISAIKRAKKSFYIKTYGISDPAIIKTLRTRTQNGAQGTVLYDASASTALNRYNHPNLICAPQKSRGLMHQKIVMLDEQTTLLGSTNLTTQSLRMHANLTIGLFSPTLASFLLNPPSNRCDFTLNTQKATLHLLPSKDALAELLTLLNRAQSTIYVAMFTFTHPELIAALISAKQRGVTVKIALDRSSSYGASKKALASMKEHGIPVKVNRGAELLHHKWALIDHKILAIGSANWTKAAFKKNEDCLLLLYDLNKQQQHFLNTLWKTLEYEAQES